jgi:hypothetical protein
MDWTTTLADFHETDDARFPYEARVGTTTWRVCLNEFPDAPGLYTLFVDGVVMAELMEWPASWSRSALSAQDRLEKYEYDRELSKMETERGLKPSTLVTGKKSAHAAPRTRPLLPHTADWAPLVLTSENWSTEQHIGAINKAAGLRFLVSCEIWRDQVRGLTVTSSWEQPPVDPLNPITKGAGGFEWSTPFPVYRLSLRADRGWITDGDRLHVRRTFGDGQAPTGGILEGGDETNTQFSAPVMEWGDLESVEIWDLVLPYVPYHSTPLVDPPDLKEDLLLLWQSSPHCSAINAVLERLARGELRAKELEWSPAETHVQPRFEVFAVIADKDELIVHFIVDFMMTHDAQSGSDWKDHHICHGRAVFRGPECLSESIEESVRINVAESWWDFYDRDESVKGIRKTATAKICAAGTEKEGQD